MYILSLERGSGLNELVQNNIYERICELLNVKLMASYLHDFDSYSFIHQVTKRYNTKAILSIFKTLFINIFSITDYVNIIYYKICNQ